MIVLLLGLEIGPILAILDYNMDVFIYTLGTFVFWWKMCDGCILIVTSQLIDYYNNINEYESDTSMNIKYLLSILVSIVLFTVIFAISSIHAYVKSFRFKKLLLIFIVAGLAYFLWDAVSYFIGNNDVKFVVHIPVGDGFAYHFYARTLLIEKAIDLSIFCLSQLTVSLYNHFAGIQVTVVVKKIWTTSTPKSIFKEQLLGNETEMQTLDLGS